MIRWEHHSLYSSPGSILLLPHPAEFHPGTWSRLSQPSCRSAPPDPLQRIPVKMAEVYPFHHNAAAFHKWQVPEQTHSYCEASSPEASSDRPLLEYLLYHRKQALRCFQLALLYSLLPPLYHQPYFHLPYSHRMYSHCFYCPHMLPKKYSW